MSAEPLLSFEPPELIFHLELNKQLSSSIRFFNKTENHVAFKLLTTNQKKYGVRPKIGLLLPGSACEIRVTMGAIREHPHNIRCKDRFMIQSAIANPGATMEDAREMFNKEAGHVFEEYKLRVVYRKPESWSPNVPEVSSPVVGPDDNVAEMSPRKLLDVQPSELKFPLGPRKDVTCMLQLSNVTEDHVAYRVKTRSQKFAVEPNIGNLSPQSTCVVTVKLQGQSKIPAEDLQFEDKFVIQTVVGTAATAVEDIQDMFDGARSPIEKHELQVIHVPEQEDNTSHTGELILRGTIICIFVLGSCYVMKQTLSLLWSLAMLVLMLMIKMLKKLVSDSLEDWVVKALISIVMYIFFGRKGVQS